MAIMFIRKKHKFLSGIHLEQRRAEKMMDGDVRALVDHQQRLPNIQNVHDFVKSEQQIFSGNRTYYYPFR